MNSNNLELAFYGGLAEGKDPATVRASIAALFKANEAQVERMFSGNRVVIKNRLDIETAEKYVQAMLSRGAICKIEVMGQPGQEYQRSSSSESTQALEPESNSVVQHVSSSDTNSVARGEADSTSSLSSESSMEVQVTGERPNVAGDKVDSILQSSHLEIAELGVRMQDEEQSAPAPDLPNLAEMDILPVGSRMQDEEDKPAPIVPDVSHLSLEDSK